MIGLQCIKGTLNFPRPYVLIRFSSSLNVENIKVLDKEFFKDGYTNITPKIASHLERNLHLLPDHPLNVINKKILHHFNRTFKNRRGNPVFSIHSNLSPIVSVDQNFDSLLVPKSHVSRSKSDCYYLNEEYLLRAHMTAHQSELMRSGLDNFLMVGDVYRRDEIDRTHYPVFHQMDGVRLRTREEVFPNNDDLELFEIGNRTESIGNQEKQACHTLESVKVMEHELKSSLSGLAKYLFGSKVVHRWVDSTFPFTLPSWELEVFHDDTWLELLGCGIMRQPILTNAGVTNKMGWAFGLGLERLAMCMFKIPDIRLFWSTDSGFLNQFKFSDIDSTIVYKPVSQHPQCVNDISFWLPENKTFTSNDFYDLVRNIGGDVIEQVVLVDNFVNFKTGKTSHCYRIVYRHMERTLTQNEVNVIHKNIETEAAKQLAVFIR